ncbi:uncharacterized protein LOC126630223 [Malus sylvestris]|uniref:uncharacterized protein LOC126630223 n=1 Tax=Malus sylvestris TaxID=3752 RepID=UPI0021ACF3E3|nr:uncharacterized protein LOC126630223 [Malus sylvestris]
MDAKIHLEAENLGETIKEDNSASSQDRAKAMIFIRRHLDEGLKSKYLTVENPLTLWKELRNRYNHQKTVILPRARYEWTHLRIQYFKMVAEYNSAMFKISIQLKLCEETIIEEDMLEKTFSTFHASIVLLQQQYREKGFTEYKQLIYVLLVAEKNNELLMKNHQSRPTELAPFPEVNVVSFEASIKKKGVETIFFDQAKPMDIPDPMFNLSGQLNLTHLDVLDFIIERGNEVYGSD